MSAMTGVKPLLRVSLRQDARRIAPWVVLISVLSASSILAYRWIFTDVADRQTLSMSLGANPALSLIFGPACDLMTADGFNAWRAGALGAFFAGLMAVLIVVRNSRADEDSGQAELLASGVMTREARLVVAFAMAAIASVALGVVCFLLTWVCGGGVVPTAVLAATYTASGLMFGALAAVAAQIGSDARTATSLAVGALGVFYVVRGYIDSGVDAEWARWLTPLGWLEETQPATRNNLWPLVPAVLLTVVLFALALVLQRRRDFGQGLVATKPGPAERPNAGVWGLVLRLNRGSIVTWLVALSALGFIFGNLVGSLGNVIAKNPTMGQILASGAVKHSEVAFAFASTVLQIIGIVAAIMGVQIMLRMYAEESDYRVEPLLAGALRRPTHLAANVVTALGSTALGMLCAGTGLAIAATRAGGVSFGHVLQQALMTIPAVWVLVALATALVGARPVVRLAAWLGVVATFGITLLGPTFKLPDWALGISPLKHVPSAAAAGLDWGSLAGLLAVVAALLLVGFAGYRRRDVL